MYQKSILIIGSKAVKTQLNCKTTIRQQPTVNICANQNLTLI